MQVELLFQTGKAARDSAAMKIIKFIKNCFVIEVKIKSAIRIQSECRVMIVKGIVKERYVLVVKIQAGIRRYLVRRNNIKIGMVVARLQKNIQKFISNKQQPTIKIVDDTKNEWGDCCV